MLIMSVLVHLAITVQCYTTFFKLASVSFSYITQVVLPIRQLALGQEFLHVLRLLRVRRPPLQQPQFPDFVLHSYCPQFITMLLHPPCNYSVIIINL